MIYILLTNIAPFPGEEEKSIFESVLNQEIDVDIPQLKSVSKNCKDLIKKLCDKNPEKRIKSEEALKHPFLNTLINFRNLLKDNYEENSKLLKKNYNNKNNNIIGNKNYSEFKEMVIVYIG